MATPPAIPDRILENATRLLAARGFDGVSLQEVADAVGVSKPTLLYHFQSKADLRRAVLEKLLLRWNDVLPQLLKAAASGEVQFDALVREVTGFFAADPDRARILVREVLDRPAEMSELISAHVRPWVAAIADSMRRGQERGHLRPGADPEAYVSVLVVLILSIIALSPCAVAAAPEGTPPADALARNLREVLRMAKSSLFQEPPTKSR